MSFDQWISATNHRTPPMFCEHHWRWVIRFAFLYCPSLSFKGYGCVKTTLTKMPLCIGKGTTLRLEQPLHINVISPFRINDCRGVFLHSMIMCMREIFAIHQKPVSLSQTGCSICSSIGKRSMSLSKNNKNGLIALFFGFMVYRMVLLLDANQI